MITATGQHLDASQQSARVDFTSGDDILSMALVCYFIIVNFTKMGCEES